MSAFTPQPNRDASDTIRGYVYQVDLTIERWLSLQPGEFLELECGEDIDLISRSLSGEEERRLEQVKNYNSSVTLWSAVTAIANFVEHRKNNLQQKLKFLYTTTALVTKEKLSPEMLKKKKGIFVWEQIRQGTLTEISQNEALEGIRIILSKDSKPKKFPDTTWAVFRNFITAASNEELLDLICSFEWSTNTPDPQPLRTGILQTLIRQEYATNEIQAKDQYQRLFLKVFQLLSQPDIKQLTVEERTHQLSLPTLSEKDRNLLQNLIVSLLNLESRVGTLEQNFIQLPDAIASQVNDRFCRSDFEKLRQESDFVLKDIRVDIGGLRLSRTELIANALEKLTEASLIEIVGSSGVGKSAVLKTLVEHQQGEGQVLVISGDRITGTGWNSYASSLQLSQPLNKLLVALSGSSQPTIFIDGIDRIVDTGKRAVVNDLLRTLAEVPLSEDGSRHWKVVFSAREENLQDVYRWLKWQALGKPTRLQVPELTEEELQSIVEHSPRLKPLLSLSQLSPILKNPLMLRLLEDPRMLPNPEDLPPVATEIEISKVWWNRLVGNEGLVSGHDRKNSLLKLGKQVVKSPGKHFTVEEIFTPESISSLTADRIIVQDPDREVYRFGHDLLEAWVMYRLLDQRREDLSAYLQELDEPFGLYRSVQLLGLALLENSNTADSWIQLIEQVEQASELSPRWRQALLTAPLVSPRSSELLDKAEPLLIADNARRLIELMVAIRTLEVMPNFSLMSFFTEEELRSSDRVMPLLMSDPIPRWSVWQPFMGWLLKRINDLPAIVRPEAVKLMEIWQVKSPTGSIYRKEIGEIAIALLKEEEARRGC
ncbi:ATP-binding protein [Microcoleus sp. A2-C5]|uniref:ATP-binding protein n=1 Tax=unclassified Microcoleus TaxID=2642155 RepID=UPI002FD0E6A9